MVASVEVRLLTWKIVIPERMLQEAGTRSCQPKVWAWEPAQHQSMTFCGSSSHRAQHRFKGKGPLLFTDAIPDALREAVIDVIHQAFFSEMKWKQTTTRSQDLPQPSPNACTSLCYLLLLLSISEPWGPGTGWAKACSFCFANKMLTKCCLSVFRELLRISLGLLGCAGTPPSAKSREREPVCIRVCSVPLLVEFLLPGRAVVVTKGTEDSLACLSCLFFSSVSLIIRGPLT